MFSQKYTAECCARFTTEIPGKNKTFKDKTRREHKALTNPHQREKPNNKKKVQIKLFSSESFASVSLRVHSARQILLVTADLTND